MEKYIIPQTKLGKWTLGLTGLFFLFMLVFYFFIKIGYRGGDTFFSNPPLAIPILLAGLSAIISFFTGITSVIKYRERSVFVLISILIGLFVMVFVSGEIITPH